MVTHPLFCARICLIGLLCLLAAGWGSATHDGNVRLFCPSTVTVDPSVALLPPRSLPTYLNASSTDGTAYHVYTASYPVIHATAVQFQNAEVCLPEGAAATFVVRTDVYADVAAAPYEHIPSSTNSNSGSVSVSDSRGDTNARAWIPRPDDPVIEAYWAVETLVTIRFGRDSHLPLTLSHMSQTNTQKKVYCEHLAGATMLPRPDARVVSKFIMRPCVLAAAHPGRLIPSEAALDDLSDCLYERVMQNLDLEIRETASAMFAKALRQADACATFPISVDMLMGPPPPAPITLLRIEDDPSWTQGACFSPQDVCFSVSGDSDAHDNGEDVPANIVCAYVTEYAARNIRIYESKASSDGFFHIKGLIELGYRYETQPSVPTSDIPVNGGQNFFVAFSDVPFAVTVDPRTADATVGLAYSRAEMMMVGASDTVDPMQKPLFRAASSIYDTEISAHIMAWTLDRLKKGEYIASIIRT